MVDLRGKSSSSAPSADHSPAPSSGGGPRKVAIPRLPKSEMPESRSGRDGSMSRAEKNRVSHACEPCRQRKTKCSGERPNCRHCEDFKIPCHYGDGKRDRAKNEMLTLQTKVESYEKLLEELSLQVDGAAQLAIQKAIGKTVSPSTANQDTSSEIINNTEGGEAYVSAEVGSTGSNDHVTDDIFAPLPDSDLPIGYMGKNSEIVWITNTAKELSREQEQHGEQSQEGNANSISSSAKIVQESNLLNDDMTLETPIYHMDNVDLSVVGDQIDPFALPEKFVGDVFIKAYFDTVHPTFPIVLKQLFMVQYESFYKFPFTPDSSKRWLAILNAIFAIGAVYAQMTKSDWHMNKRAHAHYFARARVLALDGGVVYEVADSQQVQVAGLMAFYLLATNQTNRAWNITGLAIRYAQALGFHLRSDVTVLSESEREMRVRIWYAINNIERLLTIMTGRPSAIQEKDCSVPLPKPMDDSETVYPDFGPEISENSGGDSQSSQPGLLTPSHHSQSASVSRTSVSSSPNRNSSSLTSLYFVEHTKLAKITVEALNSLYCPETMKMSWLEVQNKIADLESRCTKWRTSLPSILDFGKRQRDQQLVRQRMTLALHYYNTRIIINRPCLCKMDSRIPNESSQSKQFNRSAALICIEAARDLIGLIPDEPNPVGLYSTSPWWCLLHYLVSAGAVVIVEIAMRAEHSPEKADGLFADAQKVVNWLKVMGKDNVAAQRSGNVLSKLLSAAATKIGHTYQHAGDPEAPKELAKSSPMAGIEQAYGLHSGYPVIADKDEVQPLSNISLQGNPLLEMQEAPYSSDSTLSDLAFLTAFDDIPIRWNNLPAELGPSTSSMFPTPQQMQSFDVEVAALIGRQLAGEPQQHPERQQEQEAPYNQGWDQLIHFPMPVFASLGAEGPQYPQLDGHYPLPPTADGAEHATDMDGEAHDSSYLHQTCSPPPPSPGGSKSEFAPTQLNYHKQIREDILRRQSTQSIPEQGRKRRESLQ